MIAIIYERLPYGVVVNESDLRSVGHYALFQAQVAFPSDSDEFPTHARLIIWRAMNSFVTRLRETREISLRASKRSCKAEYRFEITIDAIADGRLERELARLSLRDKWLIWKLYFEGFSQRELAERLSVSECWVSKHKQRALEQLKEGLEKRDRQARNRPKASKTSLRSEKE